MISFRNFDVTTLGHAMCPVPSFRVISPSLSLHVCACTCMHTHARTFMCLHPHSLLNTHARARVHNVHRIAWMMLFFWHDVSTSDLRCQHDVGTSDASLQIDCHLIFKKAAVDAILHEAFRVVVVQLFVAVEWIQTALVEAVTNGGFAHLCLVEITNCFL